MPGARSGSRSSSRASRGCRRPSSRRSCWALERRGLRADDRLAAPPDRPRRARSPPADRGAGALSAGVSPPGAGARARRLAPGAPLADLRRGAPAVAARSAARPRAATASAASARRSCWRPSCRPDVGLLYAHYLHTPASVARYAAGSDRARLVRLGARQGRLDHARVGEAREARRLPLADRLQRDERRASAGAGAAGAEVLLTYHGLDAERFPAPDARARARRQRSGAAGACCWASRGWCRRRASRCCSRRSPRCRRRCTGATTHVGGGPLRAGARGQGGSARPRRAGRLGAARSPQDRVLRRLSRARICSCWRAGSPPTAIATACRTCCSRRAPWSSRSVASRVAAIPELIEDGVNGRLVPPDDPQALAAALARLIARSGGAPAPRPRGAGPRARPTSAWRPALDRLAARLRADARPRAAGSRHERPGGVLRAAQAARPSDPVRRPAHGARAARGAGAGRAPGRAGEPAAQLRSRRRSAPPAPDRGARRPSARRACCGATARARRPPARPG